MKQQQIESLIAEYLGSEFIRHLAEGNRIPEPLDRVAHAIRWTAERMDSEWSLPEGTHLAAISMPEEEEVE
jgi:hypothetical protein